MKIVVVTSTRADFGLLVPLIKVLQADPYFEVITVATGSHLDPRRGETVNEIYQSGIKKLVIVDTDVSDSSDLGIAMTASNTMLKMSQALNKLAPDLVVILGDRYEMLSIAFSAFLLKYPIAHISGGDVTVGALDDSIRHSITKLSSLHFTTTDVYRDRVIQLGEQPDRVFNVGNLCIDNFKTVERVSKDNLEHFLAFSLSKFPNNILVTLHPETVNDSQEYLNLSFFSTLEKLENVGIIITYPNHDAGNESIIKSINNLKIKCSGNVCVRESLGMVRYHSLLTYIDAVIGNSSSGITEVASYGIPTVDVGERQKGRKRAKSIINCAYDQKEIEAAINLALSDSFKKKAKKAINPYGDGSTTKKIVGILKAIDLKNILRKEFYDIK